MTNSFSYETITSPVMKQLLSELKYALSRLSKDELLEIFIESSKAASIATYNSKKSLEKCSKIHLFHN